MHESKAEAGATATQGRQVTRGRVLHSKTPYIATQRRKVFFTWQPGRIIFNQATAQNEPCLRDEVGPHGLPGHWYDAGVTVSEGLMSRKEVVGIRWRMLKEKALLKLKGFLHGLQRK